MPRGNFWLRRVLLAVPLAAVPVVLATATAAAAGSGLDPIVPDGQSANGHHIWQLYLGISIPALVIFLLVEGLLITIVVRDRRKRQAPGYKPPRWHGNTRLEVAWTVIPLLILVGIFTFSFRDLQNDFAPSAYANADMEITISAHQFGWVFSYPEGFQVKSDGLNATPMVIPVGKLVRLRLQSTDVIHGFWVPQLTGKTDLVPGYDNFTWLKVDHTGLWRGQCTELCGTGHYSMQLRVQAMEPGDYQAWADQQLAKATATPTPSPSQRPTIQPRLSASPAAAPGASPSPGGSPAASPSTATPSPSASP